jgi:nucleoside-diphosphate-sugar epimerase
MNSSSGKLLVTGASGFLGSEVVRLARSSNWQVRALVRNPGKTIEGVETLVADIGDFDALRIACAGVTAVVHAAGLAHVFGAGAKDFDRFNQINEAGTANVMKAAVDAGVLRVVLASSVSVYGSYLGSVCDESVPCQPRGAYAVSKRRGELRALEQMAKADGFLAVLRFATIYGEGDRGNVAKLIRALARGRFIWPGTGNNKKSLIYRQDAARACLCVLQGPAAGAGIFNVSAPPASMRQIVTAACDALQRSEPRIAVPMPLLNLAGAMARAVGDPAQLNQRLQKFIHDDVYSGAKFEAAFDFSPAVSLAEGMRREVDSLKGRAARSENPDLPNRGTSPAET